MNCRCIAWDAELPEWAQVFQCEACEIECCSLCSVDGGRRVLCASCSSELEENLRRRSAGVPLFDMLAWPRFPDDCAMRGAYRDCTCYPCSVHLKDFVCTRDELISRGFIRPFEREHWRTNPPECHPKHLTRDQLVRLDAKREREEIEVAEVEKQDRHERAVRLWAARRRKREERQCALEAAVQQRDRERQLVLW